MARYVNVRSILSDNFGKLGTAYIYNDDYERTPQLFPPPQSECVICKPAFLISKWCAQTWIETNLNCSLNTSTSSPFKITKCQPHFLLPITPFFSSSSQGLKVVVFRRAGNVWSQEGMLFTCFPASCSAPIGKGSG